MPDGLVSLETRFLVPGQLVVTAEPCVLTTVLGSCVSVVLHDPVRGAAAMNHYLMPGSTESPAGTYRYADSALDALLSGLGELGCMPANLRASVFGGARVLSGISDLWHLGERNVEAAFAWLRERRIPIVARDVLGNRARKLSFRVPDNVSSVRLLGGI